MADPEKGEGKTNPEPEIEIPEAPNRKSGDGDIEGTTFTSGVASPHETKNVKGPDELSGTIRFRLRGEEKEHEETGNVWNMTPKARQEFLKTMKIEQLRGLKLYYKKLATQCLDRAGAAENALKSLVRKERTRQ